MTPRRQHTRSRFDVEGLVILLMLLATGLIPVIAMVLTGPSDDYGTNLGFGIVIGAVIVIAYEIGRRRRRRSRDASDAADTNGEPR